MTTSSVPAVHDLRRTALGRALVLALWAAAAAGAVIAVIALAGTGAKPPAGPAAPSVLRVGDRVATSFGSMSIDYVVKLVGAPNPMGLSDAPGQLPIQVGVTLTNLRNRPLPYSPQMFRMPAIASGGIDAGRLPGGKMAPLSQHRFQLRYSVPDAATLPRFTVRDPGRSKPFVVALGPAKGLGTLNVLDHHFSRGFAG
jgi:hypothetical protein